MTIAIETLRENRPSERTRYEPYAGRDSRNGNVHNAHFSKSNRIELLQPSLRSLTLVSRNAQATAVNRQHVSDNEFLRTAHINDSVVHKSSFKIIF